MAANELDETYNQLSPITELDDNLCSSPPLPPPPPQQPLPEAPASIENTEKQPPKKKRVKREWKAEFRIPDEEVPGGIDKSCTYYDGGAVDLPAGWVVQLRPRPGGKHIDKYFYEHGTGKQFRSLKTAVKYLESISDRASTGKPSGVKVTYSWAEMVRRNKRKGGKPQPEPEPLPQPQFKPEPEHQNQPEPELQDQPEPGPEPFDFNNPPECVVWCLQTPEENIWTPQFPNSEERKRQWWEASGFGTSTHNLFQDQATGSVRGCSSEWRT